MSGKKVRCSIELKFMHPIRAGSRVVQQKTVNFFYTSLSHLLYFIHLLLNRLSSVSSVHLSILHFRLLLSYILFHILPFSLCCTQRALFRPKLHDINGYSYKLWCSYHLTFTCTCFHQLCAFLSLLDII